jgi:hypothetical protein
MLRRGFLVGLLLVSALACADTAKRLILKDGSYQSVTQYEIKGDRVRYYSAERSQWEEVPKDLVDWDATQKYEAKHNASEAAEEAKEKAEHEANAKQAEIDRKEALTPEVAPNLHLPGTGGVFVLDEYGKSPQLVSLTQSNMQIDEHTGKNILMRSISPVIPSTQTIEIPKPHALVQIHVTRPVVYLNIDSDEEGSTNRTGGTVRPSSDAYLYEFVKLEPKRSYRTLIDISTNIAGIESEKRTTLETVGQLTPGGIWIKIEPKQDLPPGEYAVVQLVGTGKLNPYVWDFGINPSAPENAAVVAPGKTPTDISDSDSKHLKD